MDNRDRQKESSGSCLSFIHSTLDDAPLTPDEKIVYIHLLRRADKSRMAWPSYQSIGNHCFARVYKHPDTRKRKAIDAVKRLVETRMIIKDLRRTNTGDADTNAYWITEPERWTFEDDAEETGSRAAAGGGVRRAPINPVISTGSDCENRTGDDCENRTGDDPGTCGVLIAQSPKGTPLEGTPLEGTPVEGVSNTRGNLTQARDALTSTTQRAADSLAEKTQHPYRSKGKKRLDRMRERAAAAELDERAFRELVDQLLAECHLANLADGIGEQAERTLSDAQEAALSLVQLGVKTPEAVSEAMRSFHERNAYMQGRAPSFSQFTRDVAKQKSGDVDATKRASGNDGERKPWYWTPEFEQREAEYEADQLVREQRFLELAAQHQSGVESAGSVSEV